MTLLVAALLGHVVPFQWVAPAGAGNHPSDAGAYDLTWSDGNVMGGSAAIYFTAVRPAWVPLSRVAAGAELHVNFLEVAVDSPVDVYAWPLDAVPAGCWQPVARVQDLVEGIVTYPAPGLVSVGGAPSIWISSVEVDAGTLTVQLQQDGEGAVSFEAWSGSGAPVPLPAIGGVLDTRGLDAGTPYYLHALLDAGVPCDAWREQPFVPIAAVEAADAGAEPPPPPPAPRGCGCSSSGVLPLLVLTFARRRAGRGSG